MKKIAAIAFIGLLSAYVAGCSMFGMDSSSTNATGNSTSNNMTH